MEDGRWKIEPASCGRAGLAAQGLGQPAFWLTGLMVLAAVAYAFDYTQSAKSTQALTSVLTIDTNAVRLCHR